MSPRHTLIKQSQETLVFDIGCLDAALALAAEGRERPPDPGGIETLETLEPLRAKALNESAALAEFERELIAERTKAGLAAARAKVRLAMAGMGQPETHIGVLCRELGVTRQTLYRHVGPDGALRLEVSGFCRAIDGGSV